MQVIINLNAKLLPFKPEVNGAVRWHNFYNKNLGVKSFLIRAENILAVYPQVEKIIIIGEKNKYVSPVNGLINFESSCTNNYRSR